MSIKTRARKRGPFRNRRGRIRERVLGKRIRLQSAALHPFEGLLFDSILNPLDGYGSFAEQVALHLDRYIKVAYIPFQISNPRWQELAQPRTRQLVNSAPPPGEFYLGCWAPGPNNTLRERARTAKHKFLYVFWESSKPPSLWAREINFYDKLFVPCDFVKEAFQRLNLRIPIEVVPPGVNSSLWPFIEREVNRPFRFLLHANAGYYDPRKNYRVGTEAFLKAFRGRKDVELVIKTTVGAPPPDDILQEKNIILKTQHFSQKELLAFLSEVDCYLCPSKGEGWGLPAREAMATGMPVIGASYGGMKSVFEHGFNYPIDYEIEKCSYGTANFSPRVTTLLTFSNAGSKDFGVWCNPQIEDMAVVMEYIVANRRSVLEMAREGSEWIHKNENYDLTARELLRAMNYPIAPNFPLKEV